MLLIASICLCLFVVVQVLSDGYATFGGHSFLRVVTGSMEPTLSVGELIMTKEVDISTVEVGDIVSFRSQDSAMIGTIITHRVVERTERNGAVLLRTKGDANLAADGYYVSGVNLIGKVVWISGDSMFAKIVSFLSSGFGFLACIALPALLIAVIILRSNIKAMRRDIEKVVDKLEGDPKPQQQQEPLISDEEYEEMRESIRAELIEELKTGGNSEGTSE